MKTTCNLKRAYLVELSVWLRPILRCFAIIIPMGLFIGYVTETAVIMPLLSAGLLALVGVSAFSGDKPASWERLKLTMPLSRDDLVLVRYLFIITLALIGVAGGILTDGILALLASAGLLPESLSAAFLLTQDSLMFTAAVTFAAMSFAIVFASISIPINIKLSTASAIIIVMIIYVLVMVGAMSIDPSQTLPQLRPFLETPFGIAQLCAGAFCFSLVVMAVSLQISRKLYATFEF